MKKKLRGPLIGGLALALVATLGGMEVLPDQQPDSADRAASAAEDDGFLSRIGKAADNLVGGSGSGRAKPEAVSAALAVQEKPPPAQAWPPQKRVKELTGKRTANSRVYQLADGRTQAEISAVPLHYKDSKGRFQPIDTTVKPTTGKGYVQGNRTNTFTSLFGDSSKELVRFEQDGRSIELGLAGVDKGASPKVTGSTVTYKGLAGGADVVYDVTATALKEKIVLRKAPGGPVSYTFTLDTAGLTAQQRQDGSIAFVGPNGGEPVFVMPAPFMYDDKDDASSPHGKVWSDKVSQRVQQVYGQTTVTVSADAAWLADPARVYPVVIDPTIKVQPVPADAQDVAIYSGATTTNYNDTYQLNVGTTSTAAWRSLLKFNLDTIPTNTPIDDAQLQLYYSQTHTDWAYDVPMEARRVTAAWAEGTATWANMNANIAGAPAANTVTKDDGDAGTSVTGSWPYSSNTTLTPKAINGDYKYHSSSLSTDTHTWVPTITEPGNYQVEVHYVGESDRPTNAPYTVSYSGGSKKYTVDQTTPTAAGKWLTLGTHPFVAGTTGKVVLNGVPGTTANADAVRFTKAGAVKQYAKSSVWNSFPVRNVVQEWVNGTANYGFMVKALDEATKGRGGPIYEASEYAYNNDRRDFNLPKLVVTYGRQGVTVNPPTTIAATGALLDWPAYTDPSTATGDDIVEYQVHRSVHQNFVPSGTTLVAPVSTGTRTYQDTTAVPTAADNTDPMARKFYYYMVAVKTRDGQLLAGPTQQAMLPKAGQITRIYRTGQTDTTLAAGRPTENVDVYDGDPYVSPGNNSPYYGDTRGLVKFPTLTGIPADAKIVNSELRMYNTYLYPGTDTDEYVDVYKLKRAFNETSATWNSYDGTNAWTTAGGDYDTAWKAGFNGFTNDPEWETWDVTNAVDGWVKTPASNYGLLLRQRDEANQTARAMLLSSEGAEPLLRPTLEVTYLEQTAESTYYAAATPTLTTPNSTYSVPVTLSNPTLAAWNPTDWELAYDWKRADGTTDGADTTYELRTPLPKSIPAGGTVDVTAQLKTPPSSTEGNKRTDYVLQWDLRNKLTTKKLSETVPAITPLPQNVAVAEPTSDQLGLEKFYSYAGKNTGAGGTLMNNLYAGNTVWSYDALSNPSRGLSTFVRMSYNSLDTSDTVAGYGWSLQASSLMRLGSPLDFHPNPNPTKVTMTDGDGTSHWFTWDSATSTWKSPKGVHLYLEKVTSLDCKPNTQEPKAWRLTKPDRTQFYYDCEGFLSSTVDKNGNTMTFTYEERKSNNKPTKFLRYITDAAGRKTLTIDYYAKGQSFDYINDTTWTRQSGTNLTNPKIIDHISQITDISGRKMTFTYTDKGLLGELVDGYGSSGTMGAPKTFKFAYDMTQGNKNVKLVKVTDPRGNATELQYFSPSAGDDPTWHWRTKYYTDRNDKANLTQFAYVDPDATSNIRTTVTDAENHSTGYLQDVYGRPIETTNAKNQVTKLEWDDDHNVTKLIEDNNATSTWEYDAKTGYPTEIRDAEAVKNGTPGTVLTYQRQLNGYVADLTEKTSPEGRKWIFSYEADGDLASVTDPMGTSTATAGDYTTYNTYDAFGQLDTAKDANGNSTKYSRYDANGYPQTITDSLTRATTFVYDVRGQVTTVTDALGKNTTQAYDTFGRPLDSRTPKDQAAGVYITNPAPTYDANDNVTQSTAPNGAVSTAFYDAADQLTWTKAPVDVAGDPERKTSFTYDKAGNLRTTTEPKGNLPEANPADYRTTNAYDEIYQLVSVTNAKGDKITYQYDNVGNVERVVDPRKNATTDTLDYTSTMTYDLAHRVTKATDALGKFTSSTYDKDGLVTGSTDQLGNTTLVNLDRRGKPTEVKVPYKNVSGTISYRITKYEYDQVGNTTKVISPRGVATTDDPDDFAQVTVYDALNRVKETQSAYDKDDARYTTADKTTYTYDEVGRLATMSAPPSAGQSVRNDTTYSYYDNGWTKSSSDPWDIVTSYDYNELGAQTARTLTSAGGSSNRTMSWSYFPDGKLKARSDDGVPVGKHVVLVDNSEFNNTTATGTWPTANTATNRYGIDYATHAAGTGTNVFTWQLNVPQSGTYQVYARFPTVSGAATDAKYTVNSSAGPTVKTVNQTAGAGTWVSLGSYSFAEGNAQKVTLSDQATGTVVADAVKLVRDNAADVDNEKHDYSYRYDANGNLTTITDASPGTRVDSYAVTYTNLNQVDKVTESKSGAVVNSTSFSYNENSAPLTTSHDKQYASYAYDERDLVSKVTNGKSATDASPKVTTYTYTDRGEKLKEVKGNGNTVDYTYFLDGLLKSQTEKKPNGTTLVSESVLDYDLNGNRSHDVTKKMNADNHGAYLTTISDFTYDPRDRLASLTKTGDGAGTETYVHDANNNVTSQTVKGTSTTFNYERNRLLTAVTGGATASYNYDPFGRLDTVTAAGTVIERNVYDGFDHVVENRKNNGTSTSTTKYTFDPMDRTSTKTTDAGGAKEKATTFNYLGLSGEVLDEEVAGKLTKSYQYSPWGQRLSQVTHNTDGTQEDGYYGYNPHTDVETLTDKTGDTKATYGYTAYGKNDDTQFTGIDKPDAADPTKEPYNAYRYNAKRWDQASGNYDMGFRDYSPGLNRFLSRDSYNGALADMNLGSNPFTGNRYAFGGGNPISNVELDGHIWINDGAGEYVPPPRPMPTAPAESGSSSPGPKPAPSPSAWGDGGDYPQEWVTRRDQMCSQGLVEQLCAEANRRDGAELVSWMPYVGAAGSGYLIADAYEHEDYVGAGLEAAAIVPLGRVGKLPKGVRLNKLVGDAYRDHVADFFRQAGKKVVTDADDAKALTFATPFGDRKLDIAVYGDDDSLLGYIETKSGREKADPDQLKKDEWLRANYGLTIDYVYDDMLNVLY
ncbi:MULTISPECIES: DNRLRE domain-containing protein [Micromonospora]|uniref:RHS repeat-associated protein n=1 Tax=Micromonospora vinacea TaxID=709878 RepID=A0ABS0KBT3_9ACTN|nr:DNRLRE domain-containing protein [Micromonospora vinacea]MBG6106099.1 RHS repeat-associated protein [Micromonospora vinacea]WSZ77668.1 DNRLRE domain-containing protein [Micromonospora sp. NBC_00860]